jgi:prepilin-type N-terminal cleavage/methylation domain-containing protein
MSRPIHGFTLIELILGLATAGILAGIALPAFLSARYAGDSAAMQAALLSSLMQHHPVPEPRRHPLHPQLRLEQRLDRVPG